MISTKSVPASAATVCRYFVQRIPTPRLAPLLATVGYYVCFAISAALAFDIRIDPAALPVDFLLQLLAGYAIWWFCGQRVLALSAQGVLMAILHIGNALKIAVLGGPIVPDDVYALPSLLMWLHGGLWLAAVLPLLLIFAALLLSVRRRGRRFWLTCAAVTMLAFGFSAQSSSITASLDRAFGNVDWNQTGNYLSRGPALYWLQEGARFLAERAPEASEETVFEAIDGLPGRLVEVSAPQPFNPRNVHMIVLESFWDPSPLYAAAFDRDPLDAQFRALWTAAGNSRILSPVFGGYTANAEFEALCGFPVAENSVKFERRLRNVVSCLPAVLAQLGYGTYASHPNTPAFWNRVNAYGRVGFEKFWSLDDFVLDDVAGDMLSDRSLYRQVREKLRTRESIDQPIFDYVLTYAGHLPFTLNEQRPHVVHTRSAVEDVANYANVVYYKSREFMEHISALREADPDAIIVAFGDHLPFLGTRRAGYQESSVLPDEVDTYGADEYRRYVGTPALVIDGKNGVVPIGELPLYQIPQLVLRLLGADTARIMDYTEPPDGLRIRPLPGLHVVFDEAGNSEVCRGGMESTRCMKTLAWLGRIETIATDLFQGAQYSLPLPTTIESPTQVAF